VSKRLRLPILAAAAAVIAVGGLLTGVRSGASPAYPTGGPVDPEAEILEKRERFNEAILARDTAALALIWTEDVHVVGSTGGRISGRDAYRERFADYFANRQDYTYRRDPRRVHVREPWGVATEHGEWRARWTDSDGPIDVGGEYLMHWRRTEHGWAVQAEMFAPLHCRGGRYCADRP
jgi:ketosteroid isomerase-like protein